MSDTFVCVQMSRATSIDAVSAFEEFRGVVSRQLREYPDPHEYRHAPIPFYKAIPERWKANYPCVYTIRSSRVTYDKLFGSLGRVSAILDEALASDAVE